MGRRFESYPGHSILLNGADRMSRKAFVVTVKHDNGCSVDNKQAICLAYDAQSAVEPNEVIVGMHTVVYEG